MHYHPMLFRRKGQFGLIWLAAHNPSKLPKHEVIAYDLEAKIDEISEFVFNGQYNRPRFSLLLSAHLMYGLCVILNKKVHYLYSDILAFQTTMKPVVVPPKTPKRARKEIEKEEIIPDVEFDLKMPAEVSFDSQVNARRLRDITLPEEDLGFQAAEQLLDDWGPMPTQYLYQLTSEEYMEIEEEFEEDRLKRKKRTPIERAELRTPLSSVDINRQDIALEIASRASAEGTEQAIRRISELQRESTLRKSTLAAIEETEERAAIGVSGIEELEGIPTLPALAEETIPMEYEQWNIPQLPEEAPAEAITIQPSVSVQPETAVLPQAEEQIEKAAAVPPVIRLKRQRILQMDRRTILSDTELKNRMKREEIPLKLEDSLNLAKIARTKGFNLLKKSNMLEQHDVFFLQPRLQRLNIANEFMSLNMRTNFQTADIGLARYTEQISARSSLATPERRPRVRPTSLSIAEQVRETTAGRSSLIDRQQASIIPPAEDTTGKLPEEVPSVHFEMPPEELPIQQQIITEETLVLPPELPSELETIAQLRTEMNEIIDGIRNGKKYFYDIVNPQNSNKKRAANLFYELLKLCGDRRIKAIQEETFGPIGITLV